MPAGGVGGYAAAAAMPAGGVGGRGAAAAMPAGGVGGYAAAAAMPAGGVGGRGAAAAVPAGGWGSYGSVAARPAGNKESPSQGTAAGAARPPAALLSALAAAALPRFPSDLAEQLAAAPHQLQQRPSVGSFLFVREGGERASGGAGGIAQPAVATEVTSPIARASIDAQAPSTSAEAMQRLLAGSGPLLLCMAGADAGHLPPVTRVVWLASGEGGRVPLVLVQSRAAAEQQQQQRLRDGSLAPA